MDLTELVKSHHAQAILETFHKLTGIATALISTSGYFIAGPQGVDLPSPADGYAPIKVNGEEMGFLVPLTDGPEEKVNRALSFLRQYIEQLAYNRFVTLDFAQTTARLWKELNFLYKLMDEIGTIFEVERICHLIVQKISRIMPADRVSIMLLEREGLRVIAGQGLPDEFLNVVVPLGEGISGWVVQTGEPVLINNVQNAPEEIKSRLISTREPKVETGPLASFPLMCTPLKSNAGILGVLNATRHRRQKSFTSDDFKLFSSIAMQTALAIRNVQMIAELRETEKLRKELELASDIQKGFLPKSIPRISGLDIAGRCVPAHAVGGDYFDFFPQGKAINIVIADVSGHGTSSALMMSNVRSSLRGLFMQRLSLSEIAYALNNLVCADVGTSGMFVTLFCLRYQMDTRKATFVNGGHNRPLVYRSSTRHFYQLDAEGSPAGFTEELEYEEGSFQFLPGDVLVLYTDGIPETINEAGEDFGYERFERVIRDNCHLSASRILENIYREINRFSGHRPQRDDITAVVIKILES